MQSLQARLYHPSVPCRTPAQQGLRRAGVVLKGRSPQRSGQYFRFAGELRNGKIGQPKNGDRKTQVVPWASTSRSLRPQSRALLARGVDVTHEFGNELILAGK